MSGNNLHSVTVAGIQVDITGPDTDVALVLVHGSLDRKAGMALIAREAQKHCAVMRYDRRGYGSSFPHEGPFSVHSNIDDLAEIVGTRKVVVFGHSFGGHMALGLASRIPESVLAVATYESPLSWMPWWTQNSAGAEAVRQAPEQAAESFMIRLVGQKRWDALPEKTKQARRQEGPALTSELSDLRRECPWNVDSIRCPVMVGVGERALEHHRRGAEWLAEHLPDARLVVISGAGHGAHASHAGDVYRSLILPLLVQTKVISQEEEPSQ